MADAPRIAIWGHYHGGNLGDELVVATIADAIGRRVPRARVVAISMAPADTRERHGIEAYPINPLTPTASRGTPSSRSRSAATDRAERGLLRASVRRVPGMRALYRLGRRVRAVARELHFDWTSYRLLRSLDLVVVAGSGQLLDEWDGPWLHPYTTFRWAMLARLARVPMVFPSVGAGPIDGRLSAFFIRTAVESVDYVSVRDGHSGGVLSSIGCSGTFPVCPDIGYGLPDAFLPGAAAEGGGRHEGTVVGLNVMSHQDPRYWPHGDVRRYEAFLAKMAEFTRWLLRSGYTVCLFSSQARADGRVARDLLALLGDGEPVDRRRLRSALEDIEQIDGLVDVVAGCDCVVAGRYHSVLLPLLLDIPVVGLAYNPKTTELFAAVDHPEQCLDIDRFTVESLIRTFDALRKPEAAEVRDARRARVARHRAAVEEQFERVFADFSRSQRIELGGRMIAR